MNPRKRKLSKLKYEGEKNNKTTVITLKKALARDGFTVEFFKAPKTMPYKLMPTQKIRETLTLTAKPDKDSTEKEITDQVHLGIQTERWEIIHVAAWGGYFLQERKSVSEVQSIITSMAQRRSKISSPGFSFNSFCDTGKIH